MYYPHVLRVNNTSWLVCLFCLIYIYLYMYVYVLSLSRDFFGDCSRFVHLGYVDLVKHDHDWISRGLVVVVLCEKREVNLEFCSPFSGSSHSQPKGVSYCQYLLLCRGRLKTGTISRKVPQHHCASRDGSWRSIPHAPSGKTRRTIFCHYCASYYTRLCRFDYLTHSRWV